MVLNNYSGFGHYIEMAPAVINTTGEFGEKGVSISNTEESRHTANNMCNKIVNTLFLFFFCVMMLVTYCINFGQQSIKQLRLISGHKWLIYTKRRIISLLLNNQLMAY
jgi:hypothetical protein